MGGDGGIMPRGGTYHEDIDQPDIARYHAPALALGGQ